MRFLSISILSVILLSSASVFAKFDFSDVEKMVKAQKNSDALDEFKDINEDYLESIQTKKTDFFNQEDLVKFHLGYALTAFEQKQFIIAKDQFNLLLKNEASFSDIANYYLGLIEIELGQIDQGIKHLTISRENKPNYRIFAFSSLKLVDLYMAEKKFKNAKEILAKLERRMRGEERYADVLYKSLQIELSLGQMTKACGWAKKLYSRYPNALVVSKWGLDLTKVEVDGQRLSCVIDTDEIAQRIRYLQLTGQEEKALSEVTEFKKRHSDNNSFEVDRVYAQFLTQEGEASKALDVLLKYFDQEKLNQSYLTLLGSTAARAGKTQLSVGMYYQAYKINPKSPKSVNSLFQAAFTSYQNQDYDGASRKFQELARVYPKTNLATDSIWHRGWIRYLKGDFEGASRSFREMVEMRKKFPKKFRSFQSERLNYWLAMSLMRQGQSEQAKSIFTALKNDPLIGYYSILAEERLKNYVKETTVIGRVIRANGRFPAAEMMLPSDLSVRPVEYSGEYEIEESFSSLAQSPEEEGTLVGTEDAPNPTEEGDSEKTGIPASEESFSNAGLNSRFEKAKSLAFWNQIDLAKWELFEIERKTIKSDSKKLLMRYYSELKVYNRAATIAQHALGPERARGGFQDAREAWMASYPEAFAESVMESSSDFGVPAELIWSIMRAETVYKKEAVSPVGAMGLMQVMAFTGDRIAKMIGIKDFDSRTLYEPEVAVQIGSKYLQRLSKKFDGSVPLVAAGYNAGPHRVKQWVWSFGYRDLDEFIEHIPFSETRNYVKKVVTNFTIYQRLYRQNFNVGLELTQTVPNIISGPPPLRETWEEI